MRYDFETLVKRKYVGSSKWDAMLHIKPDLLDEIIPFSVADMEFMNAPEVSEGLAEFIKSTVLGYSRPTVAYFDAVIGWMKRRHDFDVKREWIIGYPGVVPALFQLTKHLTSPGDGIIIMPPVYYPFMLAVKNADCKLVENELLFQDGRYEIDFDDLEKKAERPENKLLILCSPHNPVGRVWTRIELERVGEICIANNVMVISDEIHADLVMPGHKHTMFASISEEFAKNSIICTAPSKTFNIAGLQSSNIIIPNDKLRKSCADNKLKQGMMSCNIIAYKACEIAYNKCGPWLSELLTVLEENRKLIKEYIETNIPVIKVIDLEGTYLQWLDCRGLGLGHQELEKIMIDKAQLFFDEGYIFGSGGEGFERMNIACPSYILKATLERLKGAVME